MNFNEAEAVINDKTNEILNYFLLLVPQLVNFVKLILVAAVVYFVGKKIVNLIVKIARSSFERTKLEISVAHFLESLIKMGLNILLVVIVVSIIGIPTSSFIALIGSAGLAIGLSLQGSLSNFAGGVLILVLKPFKVGDYIIDGTGRNEGVVSSMDIFYTKILTPDNRLIVMPNGALSNSSITNVTSESMRRLDLNVLIDYAEDLKVAKEILDRILNNYEHTLKDKEVSVFIAGLDSKINIGMKIWVNSENYGIAKSEILEQIKIEFDKNSIKIC